MNSTQAPLVLKILAALLIIWALLLHGCFLFSAGALWRDEANSMNQASLGSWRLLWESLHYDSFPPLYAVLLRTFFPARTASNDISLRMFGVAIGVGILLSIWLAARISGSRLPVLALALLAIDPVLISEGDSIRPYGVGLLFLVWSFCAYGQLLVNPSARWLAVAAVASVLEVQASYTGALFVGVLGLSSAVVILMQGTPRRLWKVLLPGSIAVLSLTPYVGPLRQAGEWVSILHYEVIWSEYLRGYIQTHSVAFPLVWLLATFAGAYSLVMLVVSARAGLVSTRPLITYASLAAVFGIVVQIVFVQVMGVPPFPRYFLPGLMLAALALDLLTKELTPSIRVGTALIVLLITAWPSWSWVRQRHSDADILGKLLGEKAGPSDLVIVSPWFLHPSFQRYYHGPAPWTTVPELPKQPLTRYDLVRDAMMDPERENRLYGGIQRTLSEGGAIWFVSQSHPDRPAEESMPKSPAFSGHPGGKDYVEFRSYWERSIIFRLYSCCSPVKWTLPKHGPVWEEERLVVTQWRPQPGRERN